MQMTTMTGRQLPPAAAGGMNWTWNLYGLINLENARQTFQMAVNNGLIIDTADCYPGTDGAPDNETFIGQEIKKSTLQRNDMFIATKCAIALDPSDPSKRIVCNDPPYIKEACTKSLTRLSLRTIDLFYLHRIANGGRDIEASVEAMYGLLKEGKIRYIGLSEATAEAIRRADARIRQISGGSHGLDAVQIEYSLLRRAPETDGVFAACKELGINFVAYAPLCRGLTADSNVKFGPTDFRASVPKFQGDNLSANRELAHKMQHIALTKNCSPAQLSLAWVIAQGRALGVNIIPLFGTSNPKHLAENFEATKVQLGITDLDAINKTLPVGAARGLRYPEGAMKAYGFEADFERMSAKL